MDVAAGLVTRLARTVPMGTLRLGAVTQRA